MVRIVFLLAVFFAPNCFGQTQVYWEGTYAGKYYPGQYYSVNNLCCGRKSCAMRQDILRRIAAKEAISRATTVASAMPATSAAGYYRNVTKYRKVQRCNGRFCYWTDEPYVAREFVPYATPTPAPTVTSQRPPPQANTVSPLADTTFRPLEPEAVDRMLSIVQPRPGDTLADLGCGDGRILISAVRDYGCKAVGVELNPDTVKLAKSNCERAGVTGLVEIIQGDIRNQGAIDADIVTMYLFPELVEAVWPQIASGTLVISPHALPVSYSRQVEFGEYTFHVCVKRAN